MPRSSKVRFWAICASVVLPAQAQAWSEEPLCAMRSAAQDLSSEPELEASHEDAELECAPHETARLPQTPWSAPISTAEAREALARANAMLEDGKLADALIALRVVEHAMPRLADRVALRRAEILLQLDRPAEACEAYAIARESPDRNVAARASIAMVRCMLVAGEHEGEAALEHIVLRYPNLGERSELRLELARAREHWNNTAGAIAIYRSIDLNEPETAAAESAREALERLHAAGVDMHPYTALERVERAERLLQRGPVDAARDAVTALLTSELPVPLSGRAHLLLAKIARIEGRFETVRDEVALAMKLGASSSDALRLLPRGAGATAAIDPEARKAEGEAKIKRTLGARPVHKLKGPQLRALLDVAITYQLGQRATEILDAMASQPSIQPAVRFESAIVASGLADDRAVAQLLEGVASSRSYALSGRYHRARALERMGRFGEAEAEYLRVIHDDTVSPRYYAMWADLRLWSMQSEQKQSCVPEGNAPVADGMDELDDLVGEALAALPQASDDEPVTATATTVTETTGETASETPQPAADGGEVLASVVDDAADDAADAARAARQRANAERRERILAQLASVALAHGEAFPWLPRAADLVELELFEDAADEIGEAYIAWRDARGELRLRSGLEAVLTGSAPARHAMDNALRNARRSLDEGALSALAVVADELGDPGVALRFRQVRGEMRPRAYSDDVEEAASKYGVDPNLLFAVMRVESIYHRQIVSYAGAIGLMQIMPRTGMLIARKLGVSDFAVSDLLDPRTNVEFAAWYLSSLIKRFDGRLPLAIAAYNGGPHNVRVWMDEHQPDMPLDAFLERIPFDQTHRYVRRVLTHYAAYRAQQNLPMTRLDVTLPAAHPDSMAF